MPFPVSAIQYRWSLITDVDAECGGVSRFVRYATLTISMGIYEKEEIKERFK